MQVFGLTISRNRNVVPSVRLNYARKKILDRLNINLVLDVGANEGQWATEVLKGGYTKFLMSFEPIKEIFLLAKDKSQKYNNWSVLNYAIGNKVSRRRINVSSNSGLSSSFYDQDFAHKVNAPFAAIKGHENVQVQKLKNVVKIDKGSRIFLKIDTQGFEIEVLKSINKETWKKILGLEIETSLVSAYIGGPLVEEIIQFLRRRHYSPFRVENAFGAKNFGQQIQMDIIFIKNSHLDLML